MGTWALPKNETEIAKAHTLKIILKKLKTDIYPLVGDDELFDFLGDAIERIEYLIGHPPRKPSERT